MASKPPVNLLAHGNCLQQALALLLLVLTLAMSACGDQGASLGADSLIANAPDPANPTGGDNPTSAGSNSPANGGANTGSAATPSNGLTFAAGSDSQTQPRIGLDQHLEAPAPVSLTDLQNSIFTPRCAFCHTGNGNKLPGSMDFSNVDATYINLVKRDSTEYPQLPLVAPGMSTNSYLVRKIEGTALVGAQMPLQGGPLSVDEIHVIKSWIDEGAEF